ncbi:MAG: hypothetical protein ACQEUT_17735 [Bacillota bacterium]
MKKRFREGNGTISLKQKIIHNDKGLLQNDNQNNGCKTHIKLKSHHQLADKKLYDISEIQAAGTHFDLSVNAALKLVNLILHRSLHHRLFVFPRASTDAVIVVATMTERSI